MGDLSSTCRVVRRCDQASSTRSALCGQAAAASHALACHSGGTKAIGIVTMPLSSSLNTSGQISAQTPYPQQLFVSAIALSPDVDSEEIGFMIVLQRTRGPTASALHPRYDCWIQRTITAENHACARMPICAARTCFFQRSRD